MKTLENKIKEIKAGRTLAELKKQDSKSYYKVKGLASKLSELKAEQNGNFITKEDLVEYKNLIIWILKNKVNYNNYLNLNKAMTLLLNRIENENIIYKTKKGIKGIIVNLAIDAGLEDVENNLRKANGLSVLDNTYGNSILENFMHHKLTVLMN